MIIHWFEFISKAPKSNFTKHQYHQPQFNNNFIIGTSNASKLSKPHRVHTIFFEIKFWQSSDWYDNKTQTITNNIYLNVCCKQNQITTTTFVLLVKTINTLMKQPHKPCDALENPQSIRLWRHHTKLLCIFTSITIFNYLKLWFFNKYGSTLAAHHQPGPVEWTPRAVVWFMKVRYDRINLFDCQIPSRSGITFQAAALRFITMPAVNH